MHTGNVEDNATVMIESLPLEQTPLGGASGGLTVLSELAEEEIEDALAGAAREASAYFSNDEVYLEKYLTAPRHVEEMLKRKPNAKGAAKLTFS